MSDNKDKMSNIKTLGIIFAVLGGLLLSLSGLILAQMYPQDAPNPPIFISMVPAFFLLLLIIGIILLFVYRYRKFTQEPSFQIKTCDRCGKDSKDTFSYEFMAGKKIATNYAGTSRSGNTTTTTYRTTYKNITSIPTVLCPKCFNKELAKERIAILSVCFAIIAVLASIGFMINNYSLQCFTSWLFLFFLIGILASQSFKGADPQLHSSVFSPYAKPKISNLGLDTLWNHDEYKKLH